jgi:hypothetical protein
MSMYTCTVCTIRMYIPKDPGVSDLNPALEAGMVGEYLHGGLRVGVIGRLLTTTSTFSKYSIKNLYDRCVIETKNSQSNILAPRTSLPH